MLRQLSHEYALEYDLYSDPERQERVPMDLCPVLDLIAARYDGCDACEDQHLTAVANRPELLVHLVGAALTSLEFSEVPPRLVTFRLQRPGAAIALSIRSRGLISAVTVARSLAAATRRDVAGRALDVLMPLHWLSCPVGNLSPKKPGDHGDRPGDEELLPELLNGIT